MDRNPRDDGQSSQPTGQGKRRYGATRVFPRIEVGRPQKSQDEPRQAPLTPEVVEPGTSDDAGGWGTGAPLGGGPFAPRTFGGGRVRVYGCSPGCLLISVVVSLILTLLLNAIF